jgi:branched-chain amino acid transport system permease protein
MQQLSQSLYSGVLYGSVYGLMALGLTLIWGALRMLNLAHGALYVVGAYAAWALINLAGLPMLLSFLIAVGVAALMGLVLQTTLINQVIGKPGFDNASLIATVAAATMIESAMLLMFGPQVKTMPPVFEGNLLIPGIQLSIRYQDLLVIVIAVASLFAMSAFLRGTRYGMAIRAVSQNMDAAKLMGIPAGQVFLIVMVISAALAGLAGVLLSSIFFLSPFSGFLPMIKALIVTIFGGLGSIKGTIWAAYLIGLLEASLQVYLGASIALPGLFLFMIVMLVIRPNGLFGLGEGRRL